MKFSWETFWHKLRQPRVWLPCLVLALALGGSIALGIYLDYQEDQRIDAAAVTFATDLTIEYGQPAQVSDFLAQLNGELVDDSSINTTTLGPQEVTFEYVNIRNKKRQRTFTIEVVDRTAPEIFGGNVYTVYVDYAGDLTNLMLSGDDLDDHPQREILGDYDLSKTGSYNVEYSITDASGNTAKHSFTLNVVQPDPDAVTPTYIADKLPLSEVISEHKTPRTKIGIDVSAWQGEIDWPQVKAAGVEFAFIRLGYQVEYGGEYYLDRYFEQNIQNATAAGLPVGVYFYSFADSVAEARRQAAWITEQLQDYPVELGVAFDWENWSDFNNAGMGFHTINQVAEAFLRAVESHGYPSLLYSSKNYLELIWQPDLAEVWLAQYYDCVTYDGKYKFWQLSSSGQVSGIYGDVDLDIMYLE